MITGLVASLLLATPNAEVPKKDFIIGVTVAPGNYVVGLNEDLDQIKKIANTLFVQAGRYEVRRKMDFEPLLEAANKRGLKVVIQYYALEDGNTTLEKTAKDYGNHPAVIGFKVQDELGKVGKSADFYLDFLKDAKAAIRKYSDKLIMFDIIPWEFWTKSSIYEKNYPGSKIAAIDRYVNSGSIDWLIVSVGQRIPTVFPQTVERWGKKVKMLVRTSAGFAGKINPADKADKSGFTYKASGMGMEEVKDITNRARVVYNSGGTGIHYYTWKHANYQIMDEGLKTNPAFDEMLKNFNWFQGK